MTDNDLQEDSIWPPPLVPISAFDAAAINKATDGDTTMEMWRVVPLLEQLYAVARKIGSPFADGFRAITGVAMMVMSPDDPGRIWAPRQTGSHFISASPEEFSAEQSAVLAELAGALRHPALRAHVADLAWNNDRKLRSAAELAVTAYVDAAEHLLAITRGQQDKSSIYRVPHFLARALQIDNQTRKRGNRLERLSATFLDAYSEVRDRGEPYLFTELAKLALHYKLADPWKVAMDAEAAADASTVIRNPLVATAALDLAASLFGQAGDREAKLRCRLASANRRLEMRRHVSTPGAEAYWVQQAVHSLLGLKGAAEKRLLLRRELRDLQEDSLDEFASFGYPLNLDKQVAVTLDDFGKLDLVAGLFELLTCTPIPSEEQLRQRALEKLKAETLLTKFPTGHIDERGRSAAKTRPPGNDGPDEDWIKSTIDRDQSLRRQIFVQGFFEPARSSLSARCNIREAHIRAIVSLSPFVAEAQTGIVTLGLLRMLQGDFCSATYLLVPQVEPGLRNLLRVSGHDPATEYDDLTEEDVGLTAILTRFRDRLEAALPPGLILELEILFHHRAGCALRHAVAHGRISDGGCYSFDAVYACWFIFRLVGLPLVEIWNTYVAPAIRAVGAGG